MVDGGTTTKRSRDDGRREGSPDRIKSVGCCFTILRYGFVLSVGILLGYQWGVSSGCVDRKMKESIKMDFFNMVAVSPPTTAQLESSHPTVINQTEILIKNMPRKTHAPPDAIQLHDPSLPDFVQQRHTCISHIREAHTHILGPHFQSGSKRTLFLDPAYHENIGDPMLAMGTFLLFAQLEQEVMECHCNQARNLIPDCSKSMFDKAQAKDYRVAAFQAGGKNYFGINFEVP